MLFLGCIVVLSSCEKPVAKKLIDYADPFIGTGGHGHTYPGAAMPFGMVQLSPDSRLDGWDGCGGYHYSDSIIYGFSHTHLSGTGVSDYGDILLMPTVGAVQLNNGAKEGPDNGYASRFSHDKESAAPGYYAVELDDYGIKAELTTTLRAGMHRYTFPAGTESNIIFDLSHRDKVINSYLKATGPASIEGMRQSMAWATDQRIYFVADFSQPFETVGLYDGTDTLLNTLDGIKGTNLSGFARFNTTSGKPIIVKVGISAVSMQNARENMTTEIPDWDFDKVLADAQSTWEKALGKIKIEGGSDEQKTIFYTALYHSMLNPNLFSDLNGDYRGMDGKTHRLEKGNQYTVFSLWDTFRATHPLFTIIEQERTNEFIETFIRQYQQGGALPIWELAGNYTGCMIGYHAIPVIADAYAKGITDYDVDTIYKAMKHSAELDHLGLDSYKKYGYIPGDQEPESVSKTLEYAYDDWCIAQMAKALGHTDDYAQFMRRAQSYKNIYDPETKFMRAKLDGRWFGPFDPAEVNFNYTEANSWQYSFFVPQDVTGLANMMGGMDELEKGLDNLFTAKSETTGREQADITGLIGQYAHGNEPSHHMAYLYNYTGQPWKTQERVHQVLNELYHAAPDGLSGNEDCGQMSSWYVLSAMGFYPVCPGTDEYIIGTPLFDKATISLENGNQFTIAANNVSATNKYVQSATLNGAALNQSYFKHGQIMAGGNLVFEMGPEPNKDWGTQPENLPVSSIETDQIVVVPYFESESRTFTDSMKVELHTPKEGTTIMYSTDSSEPDQPYTTPITLKESTTIKAFVRNAEGGISNVVSADFYKIEGGRSIDVQTPYANQYAAGGQNALIDHLQGGVNFRTGTWQGYQGEDLVAIVNLGKIKNIELISTGFLQDIGSWIWLPSQVEYFVSMDGIYFEPIGWMNSSLPDDLYDGHRADFSISLKGKRARYVKVVAKNYGKCPEWHLGAGGDTWIFADEITIK